MKIVFFGTPHFAAKTLEFLVEKGMQVVGVVTRPDKPAGRSREPIPSPVKKVALEKLSHVPLFQPEKASDPQFYPPLQALRADLFVVVAYGEIIKQELLDMPPLGCINVHASLLPKYRGAAPIQWSLIQGEKETGVTIMHMVRKMDAGDMIQQVIVPITPEMNAEELHDLLQQVGQEALVEVINKLAKGAAPRVPQNEALVTYAPKIELEDCEIHWEWAAEKIHHLVRGVYPNPGAFAWVTVKGEKKRLKILKTRIVQGYSEVPGTFLQFNEEGIIVSCGQDAIRLIELQLEGKKAMMAAEFTRGMIIKL